MVARAIADYSDEPDVRAARCQPSSLPACSVPTANIPVASTGKRPRPCSETRGPIAHRCRVPGFRFAPSGLHPAAASDIAG
jgi:hypothetical protein